MSRLEAIFFDHDGTLTDTEPLWGRAKTELAARYGVTWTEEDSLFCLGKPAAVTFERMRELGADAPAGVLYRELRDLMGEILKDAETELLPGIPELLQEVAQAGVPAGIVTNATPEVAGHTARLAPEGMFGAMVTDIDVQNAKPHPEPYLTAARLLGVNPEFCVALEDSESGARSAQAAGMKVIVLPGMTEVAPEVGHVRLRHEELTLEVIRSLVEG